MALESERRIKWLDLMSRCRPTGNDRRMVLNAFGMSSLHFNRIGKGVGKYENFHIVHSMRKIACR